MLSYRPTFQIEHSLISFLSLPYADAKSINVQVINCLFMLDVEFETPNQVDKLVDFVCLKIQQAKDQIIYIAFLFTNQKIWKSLKNKAIEGIPVTIFAPPLTSYSGNSIPEAYEIYHEAAEMASKQKNFKFYACALWWQKDRRLNYLRSIANVAYTLHAKLLLVDGVTFLPSSNFESARHFDICVYSDDSELQQDCCRLAHDLANFSTDMSNTLHSNIVDMIKEATRMTVCSKVVNQSSYPFKKLTVLAPFYSYQPDNYLREKFVSLIVGSNESIDIMFQHFMPDIKPWSLPKKPSIMQALVEKFSEGVNVRILAAGGVGNRAAIRAEDAPILQPLLNSGSIRRNTKVHSKFMLTDNGFEAGSINISPSTLFQGFFPKRTKVDIDPCLHILIPDVISANYEVTSERFGTIWQSIGFKSSVEVLLIEDWTDENKHVKNKLSQFFNDSWASVKV